MSEYLDKSENDKSSSKPWLKSVLLTIFFLLIFFVITLLAIGAVGIYKANQFRQSAGLSWNELTELAKQTREKKPLSVNARKNILLLGIDELSNREGHPSLTDSMLFISVDLDSGKIYTMALPRDLWSPEYKTKINALYTYGRDRYPEKPEQFPTEYISQITGQEIHHSFVMSLDQLAHVIDLMGGVDVNIEEGFRDEQFPKTDADISSTNKEDLYETVNFTAGKERMSGERALKYIRSRHSQDDQGTDIARSRRQQRVISALIKKLSSFETLKNTKILGQLYLFYINNFDKYIDDVELASTIKTLMPQRKNIEFIGQSLSIHPDDETGVLFNPPIKDYDNQWVYIIKDQDKFFTEVQEKLNL